ncbi:MAG TPA: hypothetical protein VFO89_10285, partial [Thermoanaerobaculia bacterium]|nr:hypothetical protein [Thermoanaerobaculia bacterium]
KHVARLAFLLANDGSPSLHALLDLLLQTSRGFDALLAYLRERQGGVPLVHAAAPKVLARNHRNTPAFFREIFIPRCDPNRVDAQLARGIAEVLRDDSAAFRKFLAKLTRDARAELIALVRTWVESEPTTALPLARDVLADLQKQEGGIELAGPLAITLAQAGEPAKTWFDALLRMARAAELRLDEESTRVFLSLVKRIGEVPLDLSGSIEKLLPLLENQELRSPDATRALLLLTRPAWTSGGTPFVKVLRQQIERSYVAGAWEEIVLAYANDLRRKQPGDVSDVVAAFWARLSSSELERIEEPTIALLDLVNATGVQRLERGWRTRLRSLPVCAASKRLVALLRQEHSFEQEAELAIRDIENGVATPLTLTRLEAALRRVNAGTAESQFVRHAESYLGHGGPAPRLVRLLQLFASDDLLPKPRLALRVHLLPKLLQSMTRRKYWKELRTAVNEAELLSIGVPVRLAYAAGMHADRKTLQIFEGTWKAHGRNDALDALAAGRDARKLKRRLARAVGFRQASALAQ